MGYNGTHTIHYSITISRYIKFFQEDKNRMESFGLDKGVTVAKCCPRGEIFHIDSFGFGATCSKSETSWKIQINGTSYNSTNLIDKKILVYDSRWRNIPSKVRENIVPSIYKNMNELF